MEPASDARFFTWGKDGGKYVNKDDTMVLIFDYLLVRCIYKTQKDNHVSMASMGASLW